MRKFYKVDPEVAGQLGPATQMYTGGYPPVVTALEYCFDDWLGDALLQSFPVFIATESLSEALCSAELTGFILDDVFIAKSELFHEINQNKTLPKFKWLKIIGVPQCDDFGLHIVDEPKKYDCRLVVSDEALAILKQHGVANAEIEDL